jgi:hypothetical protein
MVTSDYTFASIPLNNDTFFASDGSLISYFDNLTNSLYI